MKSFHDKLQNIYEDLELTRSVKEEAGRPNFANDNMSFILAGVYDQITNVLKYDPNHEDIVSDLFGQLRQMKSTIENRHAELTQDKLSGDTRVETKTAPDGHYYTKSGNLVKGTLSKDAEERGARKSDPKDKQRSKTPPVSQYNEERPRVTLTPPGIPQSDIGGEGTFEISVDQSTLIVSIDDVEDRIEIGPLLNLRTGEPMDVRSSAGMIRIRARLETLLRKMGYNVDAPNKQGEYEVRIYWHDKTGDEIDRFKLVRKSRM